MVTGDTSVTSAVSISSQTRNKIQQIPLITLQTNTVAPRVVISSVLNEFNVTNYLSVGIHIHLGRVTTSAFTAGVNFRIETSPAVSGNGYWFPITIFTSTLGTNVGSQTVNGTAAAEQNVIPIAATANFVVGDIVYIQNATEANSEFGRIIAVSLNTSITLEDNLRFAQLATSTVTSKSEMFYGLIDTSSSKRIRVVSDGSGAAQNFDCEVYATVGA